MKHKHPDFEIITQYFKDRPGKIVSVKCTACSEHIPELIDMFQDRENRIYESHGNKSPIFWIDADEKEIAGEE